MPGFDGTGPNGQGQRTGWGSGRCLAPSAAETLPFGRGRGRGRGMGMGGGRGMRRAYAQEVAPEMPVEMASQAKDEFLMLQNQMESLRLHLLAIENRLEKLTSQNKVGSEKEPQE